MASKAKRSIINAFLKLIETEEFDKITVTALVENCGISRQTFYYHFNDIEEMLTYAFHEETAAICKSQEVGKWMESATLYADFLSRYDATLRKAARSNDFMFIYGLLYKSFFDYIASYVQKKSGKDPLSGDDSRFVVACAAHSFSGLVLDEIRKETSDYFTLAEIIGNGFKLLPKA